MYTLISIARGLLSTVAAMIAPCSVNAKGANLKFRRTWDAVANCDRMKAALSSVTLYAAARL
jgi:hypothetical protein